MKDNMKIIMIKRKSLLLIVVCVLLFSFQSISVYAVTDYQLKHAPDLMSEARCAEIKILKDRISREISIQASGGKSLSGVPNQQQINSFYCGPACTRNVLSYFGVSKTQSTLGKNMETTSAEGTYVYKIVNCLNSYLGSGTYKYISTSELAFGTGMRSSINNNKPVICHTMTGELPIYKENNKNVGHYVVATGYAWAAQGSSGYNNVTYNDPNYDNKYYGIHTCSWLTMESAIEKNAGYYIMG